MLYCQPDLHKEHYATEQSSLLIFSSYLSSHNVALCKLGTQILYYDKDVKVDAFFNLKC